MDDYHLHEFDVIVIGAGPTGENVADYAIRHTDRTAALIEGELVGGECSYYACMPSKALLRPIDIAETSQHLQGLSPAALDRSQLLARRDSWVSDYDDASQVRWADRAGITVVRGRGRLSGEREVTVDGPDGSRRLTAREAVVLATGSVPVIPDELADVRPWTSRDATGVREVSERIAVIGGGVVACEAARWLAALGAEVTLLVRGDRLLARAEPFAGEQVADGLRAAGVDVRFGVRVTGASRGEGSSELGRPHGGPVTLTTAASDDDGTEFLVDEVLVAAGRRPATDGLGLETVGLTPEDLQGRTHGAPLPAWLFTVGDVNGVASLTHWGKYQARLVGRLIEADAGGCRVPETPEDVPVPQVVFTSPEVAWVGVTSADAGDGARTLDASYTSAAGAALLRDGATGQARLVVDADDRLIGATFVGPDVAELLHSATVAIVGRMTIAQLRHAVPSYPTASEVWLRLLEQ